MLLFFFFFNDTATTEIYTLSLHDALPICLAEVKGVSIRLTKEADDAKRQADEYERKAVLLLQRFKDGQLDQDRKSTRLNSSHSQISYAVFCLKKKKNKHTSIIRKQLQTTL